MGQGVPIDEVGKATLAVRATRMSQQLPDPSGIVLAEGDGPAATMGTTPWSGVVVGADVAVGLLSGFLAGDTRLLSIDLIGSISLVPGPAKSPLNLKGSNELNVGFGSRIGIMKETARLPGVSVAFLRHQLPGNRFSDVNLPTLSGNTMRLSTSRLSGHINSVRIAIGKQFGQVGVTAGWGRDQLQGRATVVATLSTGASDDQTTYLDVTRTSLFAGASYPLFRGSVLAAEVARTSTPHYDAGTARSRTTVSAGVRIGQ
jgi:hypothetical protein